MRRKTRVWEMGWGGPPTCILRAFPTDSCGWSPSPPISFDVSMIMTLWDIASWRAMSRMIVVFPVPGGPRRSTLPPTCHQQKRKEAERTT